MVVPTRWIVAPLSYGIPSRFNPPVVIIWKAASPQPAQERLVSRLDIALLALNRLSVQQIAFWNINFSSA